MTPAVPDLTDGESLGRTVLASRLARRARRTGGIHPRVFRGRPGASSISVDRLDHAPETVMAALAKDRAARRVPPRQFHGRAVLSVRDASTSGRTVRSTPVEGNPFHVDIVLNSRGPSGQGQQQWHAVSLALGSFWREAPD